MLEKLTKEQEKIMFETRDEWINLFFDNVKNQKGIDKPMFEEGIEWLYTDLLHKPKPKVVYCDSWLSCLLTIAILKDEQLQKKINSNIGASVRDSVGDSVWDIWGQYSSYIDLSNYGWVSFYDFFEKIEVLDNFKFKKYKKLIKSGVFNAYEYENIVFAIQPPVYVERNEQGRLHSTTTAAVKFKDGSCYHFVNGRSIPSWVIEDKDSITKDKFLQENNSDIKGAIYEVLGTEQIMNLLGTEVVDKQKIHHANGDIETVELLKTQETFPEFDDHPLAWVKMVCPSTGTTYLQGVEPQYTNAIDAIASLSPFTKEEYSFNYRS